MASRLFSSSISILLALLLFLCAATVLADVASDAATGEDNDDLAAEEAAAAAVGEAVEDEEEDDADALDEDADAARPDPDRRHPLTDLPPAADDVDIGHTFTTTFPKASSDRILVTLGSPLKALIAFANRGRTRYHIWGVMGSLNMEKDFRVYVQNFTYGVVNKTVGSGGELSFSYSFTPNERLDTTPFQLALNVFYEAQSPTGNAIRGHSTTFFNSTIATEAGPQSMSNSMFMIILVVLIVAAAGGYYAFMNMEVAKNTPTEMGTEDTSKNEWLEEHHNLVSTGGGRARSRAGAKK